MPTLYPERNPGHPAPARPLAVPQTGSPEPVGECAPQASPPAEDANHGATRAQSAGQIGEQMDGDASLLPAEQPSGATPNVRVEHKDGMLALIDRYVHDPSVDIERLERLLAMKERLDAREAEIAFNEALAAAQGEIQPVARTTENTVTRSWYAKLEAVDAAIRPIYLRHGFSLSYSTVAPLVTGNIRIECRCSRGAHTERYYREAGPDTLGPKGTPTKTALHGSASTETFLRRYLTCGIFNVVFRDLDDDGVGGSIDENQATHLRDLLKKAHPADPVWSSRTYADFEAAFLKTCKARSIEEILYREYPRAVARLEERIPKGSV